MSTFALKNTPLRAGPGGRSSVSGATATVFGATGAKAIWVWGRGDGKGLLGGKVAATSGLVEPGQLHGQWLAAIAARLSQRAGGDSAPGVSTGAAPLSAAA
jgi:hypothetical protein